MVMAPRGHSGSRLDVPLTTMDTRGSRLIASVRCRCDENVSQTLPLSQTKACITPTGQPSLVAQFSTHSGASVIIFSIWSWLCG